MWKLILKNSLHLDNKTFYTPSTIPLLYFINLFNIISRQSSNQVIILVFYLVLIIIYALFPIKLAKGLYLCPLTEDDRKKYLMTAAYMRFGILMLIYGILLLINRVIYQPSIIILVLQYIFGSLLIFTITLLYIHPGIYSVDTAMQTYSALKKMPVNSKPKAIKVSRKTAGKSIALLIAVTLVCTVALFLPGSKKELNPYLWYYYIPAFICSVSCIVIYYKKYLDELISLFANQELYQYMKKKAGVFHAD